MSLRSLEIMAAGISASTDRMLLGDALAHAERERGALQRALLEATKKRPSIVDEFKHRIAQSDKAIEAIKAKITRADADIFLAEIENPRPGD